MMTIGTLKQDLAGVIHGTSLDKVVNLNGLLDRAARKLLADLDPQETRRIVEITSPIYNHVTTYPIPTDVKGNRIIDIYPQVRRGPWDTFSQIGIKEFGMYNSDNGLGGNGGNGGGGGNWSNNTFNIKWNNGFKSILLANNDGSAANVNSLNNLTANGTWTAGGDASGLVVDNLNYVTGGASLKFNVDGVTGVAFLENSSMTTIDISVFDNEGAMFTWIYIPMNPTVVTGVTMRWGSSSGDYFQQTVVSQQDGNAFQFGWNLLRLPWNTALTVGAPNSTAINYLRLSFTYPLGTPYQAFRFNQVSSQLGQIYLMDYYSKFLFRDALTGVFQENVTDDSNIINLDTDSYNVYFNIVAEYCNQQISGQPANFDIGYFAQQYAADVARYVRKYPSEVITPTFTYYRMIQRNNVSQRRFFS